MATSKVKSNPTVELFLSRSQINGLMYVLDCYLEADPEHKYGQFAKKMKDKIINHASIIMYDDEETVKLHMYETDIAIMLKLYSTYISAIQEMPKDYFLDIVESRKNKKTSV
ncbi:hypothetical protein [Ruminococcus flavefaciens]|uniref:hypothetical protein n=1 Tax=Ruminococcus flavefaciens TaxID=1265 RepID=UPI0026F1C3F5|nr:hypothetical protein [Ruminococcus flavefaciens]